MLLQEKERFDVNTLAVAQPQRHWLTRQVQAAFKCILCDSLMILTET